MGRGELTRRAVVGAGLGTAAGLTLGALPALARPSRHLRHHRPRRAGGRPHPDLPMGTPGFPHPVENVVVLMLENHSFDNILGMLPYRVAGRRGVDGLPGGRRGPAVSNPDAQGHPVGAFHLPDLCPSSGLTQSWNASHMQYNGGRNDGFVRTGGAPTPMGFFDEQDLPVTYALAARFPISDRYFGSVLAQTYPNRRFLFAATANGTISTDLSTFTTPAPAGTIFDRLSAAGLDWRVYYENQPSPLIVPGFLGNPQQVARCVKYAQFTDDAARGRLPAFSLLDPQYSYESEENPQDVAYGERYLHDVVSALFASPQWRSTALLVTYDEHGGFYDHVPPPAAVRPDATPPKLRPGDVPGAYDRYGFRVPFTLISPWARPAYVSHVTADHTSILSFLEHKWNLPALTSRDAVAWPLADLFDVSRPAFLRPPALPAPPSIDQTLARCRADGQKPPTPTATSQTPLSAPPSPALPGALPAGPPLPV